MAVEAHLSELAEKHRMLDRKIEEEISRPYADDFKIQELKREKLKLKDEISKLETETRH